MPEGLEVVIKYKDQKYIQVNSPNLSHSKEIAILKTDLAHLRVHSPAQRNVRRQDGSFILHWPTAGTSPKVKGLADSLHMRWFKLCSNDPDALKLREFLSIESITLTHDGLLLRSTDDPESIEGLHALAAPLNEIEQPTLAPAPTYTPHAKPQPLPPKAPPTAPRSDRFSVTSHHPLKRKMSNAEGPPPTRQKLDTHDTPPHLISTSPRGDPRQVPHPHPFDRAPMPVPVPAVDVSPTTLAQTYWQSQVQSPVQAQVRPHTPLVTQRPPTPVPEAGEITSLPGTPMHASTPTVPAPLASLSSPMPIPAATFTPPSPDTLPLPAPSTTSSAPIPVPLSNTTLGLGLGLAPSPTASASRPPTPALAAAVPLTGSQMSPLLAPVAVPTLAPPTGPRLSHSHSPTLAPPTGPRLSPRPHPHARPHPHPRTHPHPRARTRTRTRSTSPHPKTQTHTQNGNGNANGDPTRRRDVQRLTRELWDTRRQLTAVQAREQVILDDLERLGARPEGSGGGAGDGAGLDQGSSRDELLRLEAELRVERTRRIRAERSLTDVERECRAPFVVPALFQAFVVMSELAS